MNGEIPGRKFGEGSFPMTTWVLPALLFLAVLAVYSRTGTFSYVNLDDPFRVARNPHVLSGLSWDNLRWAITSRESADSYPLTWISFQLVAHGFGPGAGPQHLANVLLHAINGVLVFHLFKSMTGRAGLSAVVAGLFALHPLHVESVAWVSGRKDVLSTLFWLLALQAYVHFARSARLQSYMLVTLCFLLGLTAKAMLVTLPATLLILDFWPLERFKNPVNGVITLADAWKLLHEKFPLIMVAGLGSLYTLDAQSGVGAIYTWAELPLSLRLANAATAAVDYLGKLCWPAKLAIFYPHPGFRISLPLALLGMVLIAGLSLLAWRLRRQRPYLLAGWLWLGLTLLPVIGLVQIGAQAMAWGSQEATDWLGVRPRAFFLGWSMVLAACAFLSYRQVGYWRETRSVFEHAEQVTEQNWMAHMTLGRLHLQNREFAQAAKEFRAASEGTPSLKGGRGALGIALMGMGRNAEALEAFRTEYAKDPRDSSVNLCLGILHMAQDHPLASLPYLRTAAETHEANVLELERVEFQALLWLARARRRLGQYKTARGALRRAQQLEPHSRVVAEELDRPDPMAADVNR